MQPSLHPFKPGAEPPPSSFGGRRPLVSSMESIAWLKQQLGSACVEVPVQGDQPLLLDDPSCAYVTLSEHHQVFCVAYENGAPVGRREHMATCHPGQLLFGLLPAEGPGAAALILTGVSGSVVWRVPTALLFRLTETPEGHAVIGALFDDWVRLLIATLPPASLPARTLSLTPGETVDIDGQLPVRSASGVAWVAPKKLPRHYREVDVDTLGFGADCWPIDENAWVHCEADRFRVWRSADLIRASGNAAFGEGFCGFVVRVASARREEFAATRLGQDTVSREAERALVGKALTDLAAVGRAERLASDVGGEGDFEQSCRLIAQFLETDMPRIVRPLGQQLPHIQMALSRMTGARTRAVLLERDWYRHDNGPLLAFVLEEEDTIRCVALLPSRSGYRLHDPRSGTSTPVTNAVSDTLHPQAHQFYAPMPGTSLPPFQIFRFASRHAAGDLAFAGIVGMLMGALGTTIPLLTGQVFDRIVPAAERSLLFQLTSVLLIVYFCSILFDLGRGLLLVRAQTRMDTRLEAAVWDRLLSLPLPFFRKYSAGDLAARAAGIGGIREVLAGTTTSAILGGVFSVWNLGYLYVVDPRLALAATGLVTTAGLAASVAAVFTLRRQRIVAELDGKIGGLLLQLFTGMAKLRVTGAENRAFGVWARLFAKRRDADLGAEKVTARVGAFQSVYPTLCSIVLFWLLASGETQRLGTGDFLAFNAAFAAFLGAVLGLIDAGLHSLVVFPMYDRARPILTERVESQGGGDVRTELKGSIEVSHVSFRYDAASPLILDDVNLRIEPKEFVAIVGASGSGKSTLLRLLLGFENCTEGGVFYDRQALSGLDLRAVRQQIGVVLQTSRVMDGDVFTNIVGNTGLTIEDAWRAARQAALDKDIEAMPMGMHTVLAQGGSTLSGGQRQRLLIARSLAAQPKILFFDEATSALDNVTQASVSQSLENLRVTRMVIAHRLSTIRHADKIVVLDQGKVVQVGRFEDLIDQQGPFRLLAARQQA